MKPASQNPFRAERLDALDFQPHQAGLEADVVVDRFRQSGWWGAVVGPHGTGKSTLLRAVADAAEAEGRIVWRPFLNGQSPLALRRIRPPAGAQVWAVDGWCHLAPPRRGALRREARRRGAGVLGTAHLCGWGLPVQHRTRATPELLANLVERLAPDERIDAAALLARSRGNVREALFALYDRSAGRASGGSSTPVRNGGSRVARWLWAGAGRLR